MCVEKSKSTNISTYQKPRACDPSLTFPASIGPGSRHDSIWCSRSLGRRRSLPSCSLLLNQTPTVPRPTPLLEWENVIFVKVSGLWDDCFVGSRGLHVPLTLPRTFRERLTTTVHNLPPEVEILWCPWSLLFHSFTMVLTSAVLNLSFWETSKRTIWTVQTRTRSIYRGGDDFFT